MASEKAVEAHFNAAVKSVGGWAIKLLPFNVPGLPDRLAFMPGGWVVIAEIKTTGEQPKPKQLSIMRRLARLGFKVHIIDTKEKVDRLRESWTEKIFTTTNK